MKKILLTLLTVVCAVSNSWGYTYTKVTSAPQDWSGEYVVTTELSNGVNYWTGIDAVSCHTAPTMSGEKIVDCPITITVAALPEGGYSVKVNGGANDGKYISSGTSAPGYSNGLKFNDAAQRVDFAYVDGAVQMSQTISGGTNDGKKMYFLFNSSSSNLRFRFYKETNLGNNNYPDPVLYKKDAAAGIAVTGVTLDKTSATLNVGETTPLAATVAPANADNKSVTWTTSDANVATVSNAGVVTGVAAGSAIITVKTVDGNFSATCNVTVNAVTVNGVTLDKTEASVMEGETETLVATITPANAANKNVTWTSDNEAVATVDNGVVTAVSVGSATITATTVDGGYTANCVVTVTPYVEPNEIEIVFAPSSSNSDSSTSWNTSSTISNVFSDGAKYVSNITAVNNVYPARNTLVNGVKFGTSSVAGSITLALDKTYTVSKIVVTAALYGDAEGKDGFTLNGKTVAMTNGMNKVYADYDVNVTGDVSNITLTQKTASSGRIYVKSIKLVKAPVSADITISNVGYTTYFNSTSAYTMPSDCEGYVFTAANGLELAYDAEEVVPAGEPLVIYTVEPGTKTLNFTTSAEETYKQNGMNDLDGTDEETALDADTESYFYGLSLNAKGEADSVGFYWMEEDGAAFRNGAHKAYLKLAKSAGAKSAFRFNNTTGIKTLNNEQSVNKAVKRIMNGQLIIEKAGKMFNAAGAEMK